MRIERRPKLRRGITEAAGQWGRHSLHTVRPIFDERTKKELQVKSRWGTTLLAAIILAASVFAGVLNGASPARTHQAQPSPQAPSAEVADEKQKKVDEIFSEFNKPDSPGCAVGVVDNMEFVYKHAYGLGSLELGTPLTAGSVFYLGSVSKQFTAASVVLAAEQGSLTLDDDVRKWIPEMPDYGQRITLRHLLHHTSGIRDIYWLLALAGQHAEDIHPLPELLAMIERQKQLNFKPGEKYAYSNSNYVLLAEVVHRATGKPLSQFAQENIFGPLGMTHTRFYDDRTVVVRGRVPAYSLRREGGFQVDWSTNFQKVGDGGLMSSMDDLLLWDRNFYKNKLGKGTLPGELQTRGVRNDGKEIEYGLGLFLTKYRGLPVTAHDGALFGYRSAMLRFPEQKFSVICLCNVGTADPVDRAEKVADVFLANKFVNGPTAAEPKSTKKTFEASDLRAFAGLYRDAKERSYLSVEPREGGLGIGDYFVGTPSRPGVFSGPQDEEARFELTNGGMRMKLSTRDEAERVLERIDPIKPNAVELAEYTGDYYSDEFLATYKIRVRDGRLTMTIGWNEPEELEPAIADEFRGTGVLLRFVLKNGNVTGFEANAGGMRDMWFEKK